MVNNPINNGLIMGGILMVTSFLMAFISPEKYVLYSSFLLFIIVVIFMIKIGRDQRKLNEGILSFGEAFKAIFLGSAVAFAMCTGFEYVLNNIIFPDLNTIRHEQMMGIFDWMGEVVEEASGEDITSDMEEAKDSITPEMTSISLSTSLYNFFVRLIFPGAIVGLIAALITKKDPSGV